MARVIRSKRAKRDVLDVLAFTKERWGSEQARRYRELIREAIAAIGRDPQRGKVRDDLRARMRALHIRQHGRPARHVVFYRVRGSGVVEVVHLLHDGMDFAQHLP